MNSPSSSSPHCRQHLLDQLAAITTMQRGTLAEEFREHPSPDGKDTVRLGPYFKHQCWEDGRNLSRRIPAHQVPALREDLANGARFNQITEQLARLNIEHTRALRAAEESATSTDAEESAAKKNSRRSASPSATRRPRASSRKPAPGSANKGRKG
jgi:hypothetical protein